MHKKHNLYDLVKVDVPDDRYFGAIGIIKKVDKDPDGKELYELLFTGEYHNKLAREHGDLFYGYELEGI